MSWLRAWRSLWLGVAFASAMVVGPRAMAAPPQQLNHFYTYTVRAGDTQKSIAAQFLAESSYEFPLWKLNTVKNERDLKPNRIVRIPLAWMKVDHPVVKVLKVQGPVKAGDTELTAGGTLPEGSLILTGKDGTVTLQLADGTKLTLQGQSELKLETLRTYGGTGISQWLLRLLGGRVETEAQPLRIPGSRFEIHTPSAVSAVRGTKFRVGAKSQASTSEVLTGQVQVAAQLTPGATTTVPAGFGTQVDDTGKVLAPVPLLPAPDLTSLPTIFDRSTARFSLALQSGARAVRAQLSQDATFESILRDLLSVGIEVAFAGLPDGTYLLRVRAIDQYGIEGLDAAVMAARSARRKVRGSRYTPEHPMVSGRYYWRMATSDGKNERGPFSTAQAFELRGLPGDPKASKLDDHSATFEWSGEPGQTFKFQFAADAEFQKVIQEYELTEPTVTLKRPEPGSYYIRVRARDSDGTEGPYTRTQRVMVNPPKRQQDPPWWLWLAPLPALL